MNKTLEKLIDSFLINNTTSISKTNNNDKNGYSLFNESFNSELLIFSDKENSIYFELKFLKDKKDKNIYGEGFTYKCPLESVLPILNNITEAFNVYNNKSIGTEISQKYINLFQKALNNEEVPTPYSITYTRNYIELREEGVRWVTKIKQNDIEHLRLKAGANNDPTTVFTLTIHDAPGTYSNTPIILAIPMYALKNYSMLEPKVKQKNTATLCDSVDDWIAQLKAQKNINSGCIHDIFDYIELQRDLPVKETPEFKKYKI